MKNIFIAIVLLFTTITNAQKSLFSNISTTDYYQEYKSLVDTDKDGVYDITDRGSVVKFNLKHLPTGEGYAISGISELGNNKGDIIMSSNAVDDNFQCAGYPFESYIKYNKNNDGLVAIDNYVFYIKSISKDGKSFKSVNRVYVNIGNKPKNALKKPKMSSMQMIKMLTSRGKGKTVKPDIDFGKEHKALQSKNIDKMITDYLVTMKTKQDGRTATQKQADNKILKAKKQAITAKKDAKNAKKAARDAEWAEAKRYNDSVKGTAKWQEQNRRIRQNEANYQSRQKADVVTLRNTTGSTIYVARSGSKNRGTKIIGGGNAKWNCNQDAYIQVNNKTTNRKVYRKNSGCGNTVSIN